MKPVTATMTSKGQVTVPAGFRRALGLKPGDKLVFTQDGAGKVYFEARVETIADLRGMVGRPADASVVPVDSDRIADWIDETHGARWHRRRDAET